MSGQRQVSLHSVMLQVLYIIEVRFSHGADDFRR